MPTPTNFGLRVDENLECALACVDLEVHMVAVGGRGREGLGTLDQPHVGNIAQRHVAHLGNVFLHGEIKNEQSSLRWHCRFARSPLQSANAAIVCLRVYVCFPVSSFNSGTTETKIMQFSKYVPFIHDSVSYINFLIDSFGV